MPPTARRPPLTRDRVLRAAVDLANTAGIEALSMRKLGDALGVEAMSLYNHVSNKFELLDGMVDVVFAEIDLPPTDVDWRTAMRTRALSGRRVLTRHRWAIGLMESRSTPGPATLHHHDATLGCLRRAGFSVVMTGHAYALLDSFVYGFAVQEASLPFESPEDAAQVAHDILTQAPAGEYPYLAELAAERVLQAGYDLGDEFAVGLDLLLGSLERAIERQ
jgi:AcrR family transcriptional regulator